MSYILGISAFYHDSAATLIKDGNIIGAVQEERFTRIKNDENFPTNSIEYLLAHAGIKLTNIDFIVFYEKPFLKFNRLIEIYLAFAPSGFLQFLKSMPIWIKQKLFQKNMIIDKLREIDTNFDKDSNILFSEHHLSHAASAFYPSPFKEAIILTLDAVGEWTTTSIAIGNQSRIDMKSEIRYPHSIGLLYSAFTYYCGFKVNEGEYKLMGLAPYGNPKYKDLIYKYLLTQYDDGSFKLNLKYFDFHTGLKMVNNNFCKLFQNPVRKPEEEISQFYMDIASSIQIVLEEVVIKICKSIKKDYGIENLCLAGGVALNCVANGKIAQEKIFKNIWIQPASGDAGGSLGAALAVHYNHLNLERKTGLDSKISKDGMKGSYLGPSYSNQEIGLFLKNNCKNFEYIEDEVLLNKVAKLISEKKVVGWFAGRMEFGPRALGARSILADPRGEEMQSIINKKIKFREGFRPFAPIIKEESLNEWFDTDQSNKYMLMVSKLKKNKQIHSNENQLKTGFEKLSIKRSDVPAVTHVDFSARAQSIDEKFNPRLYKLINEFEKITNIPMLVNTSFNIRDEPIVLSYEDAYRCFLYTDLDYLVLENYFISKEDQFDKID
tara:strand:- start:1792 stop:3609 length:1818 start_codon:yes stop_codon:yes gene_type:complete